MINGAEGRLRRARVPMAPGWLVSQSRGQVDDAERCESGIAQEARPAGADRRRVHGQLRLRAADRDAGERRASRSGSSGAERTRSSNGGVNSAAKRRSANDTDVTDADIANSNLVLWGDPGSNKVLARIADKLPVKWTATRS